MDQDPVRESRAENGRPDEFGRLGFAHRLGEDPPRAHVFSADVDE
jgi:hypothetical protein